MVGRSNVGKSSLINELLKNKDAQVSKEPGKTRQIHFYLWEEIGKVLADLPGYGYAKAGHAERERWAAFIAAYLKEDENLEQAIVLLDARHGPTDLDIEAIRFLSLTGIPVNFVFSKVDAIKNQAERSKRKKEAAQVLRDLGFDPERAFWVSSHTRAGLKELTESLKGSS
jgi:GTP-binding protein